MFNRFPYTNFHDLNLDWIISEIRRVGNQVDSFSSDLRAYVREYLAEYLDGDSLDVAGLACGFVNIRAFGLPEDGGDCTEAFEEAVKFCNRYKVNLRCNEGERYTVLSPVVERMMMSVDCNNSTFIMGGSDVEAAFLTFGEAAINRTYVSSDYNGVFTPAELKNATFFLQTEIDIGLREGTEYHLKAGRMIVTDPSGFPVNGTLTFDLSAGFRALNIRNRGVQPHRFVKNANIEYGSYSGTKMLGFALSDVDNFTFENINVSGQLGNGAVFTGSVLKCKYVDGCVFRNINGSNPTLENGSGYVIGVYGSNGTIIDRCGLNDGVSRSWGVMGGNFLSNTTVTNSDMQRIDCHYLSYGFLTVDNCSIQLMQLPEGGEGVIIIQNSNIDSRSFSPIVRRREVPILFNGEIVIKDCSVTPSRTSAGSLLDYTLPDNDIVYGADSRISIAIVNCKMRNMTYPVLIDGKGRLNTPTVRVEGCTIDLGVRAGIVRSETVEDISIDIVGCNIYGNCTVAYANTLAKLRYITCALNPYNPTGIPAECSYIGCRIPSLSGVYNKLLIVGCVAQHQVMNATFTECVKVGNLPSGWTD